MKYKVTLTILVLSCIGVTTAQAGFLSSLAKLCGVKENSTLGSLARTADEIGNAVIAKKVNDTMNKYGSEQVNNYNGWAKQYNDNKDRKVQKYMSEIDSWKMDYCKSHGFYDLWYSQYGEDWFEKEGRSWFDAQDEASLRRTGDRILPWHLRDAAGVSERANNSKVETSLTEVVLNGIGMSSADVERANQWTKSDKYGKQDMIIDEVFNLVGRTSSNKGMVEAFRKLAKANNEYLKDKSTPGNSNIAFSKMALNLSEIVSDTYQEAAENKKRYVAEKLGIQKQLINNGISPEYAEEIAGTVLSVNRNKNMSEHEKTEWLRLLGFYGKEDNVKNLAETISGMSDSEVGELINEERQKNEILKKERNANEEKERKERERAQAISRINETVVDSYQIREVNLNEQQEETLSNIAESLKSYPDFTIVIVGHTCDIGTDKVNNQIGLLRAEKAKEFLIESGVDENRISIESMGESNPFFGNDSNGNRMKNRRVTFAVK